MSAKLDVRLPWLFSRSEGSASSMILQGVSATRSRGSLCRLWGRSFRAFRTDANVTRLLEDVAKGTLTPQEAASKLSLDSYEDTEGFAKIDKSRSSRTGFPEVVFAEGKTPRQIARIIETMTSYGEKTIMATRLSQEAKDKVEQLLPSIDSFTYYEDARILANKDVQTSEKDAFESNSRVCVLCAGTSDLPVSEEAAITLELAGFQVTRLYDVGVAGIHRLLQNQHILRQGSAVICVAGMDGALPGVVGGLTDAPVVAVPTSIGYGAAFNGLAPLLTMLNACSPGVGVVNIDNGFGAAVLAARILRGHQTDPDDI